MSRYEETHFSHKEAWITQIILFFYALLIFSPGPILLAMETLHQYQGLVYRYDKYQDIPGASELHVINIDLDMRRNGNLSMHCTGLKSRFFRLADIIDTESFSKRPHREIQEDNLLNTVVIALMTNFFSFLLSCHSYLDMPLIIHSKRCRFCVR